MVETLVDIAARELGHRPAELRRRNMIPAERDAVQDRRWSTPTIAATSTRTSTCLGMARLCGLRRRRAESEQRGKLRGLGIANTVERPRNAGLIEHAEIRFDPAGTVTVIARHPRPRPGPRDDVHARSCARQARHRYRRVSAFEYGDTDLARDRCRHLRLALAVLRRHRRDRGRATRSSPRASKIAAHLMEAAERDIEFERRHVHGRRHRQDGRPERGRAQAPSCRRDCRRYRAGTATRPAPSTAASRPIPMAATSARSRSTPTPASSRSLRYTAVDDVGHVINPLLLEGQIHGGIVQGVGQALRRTWSTTRPASC